MPGATGLQVLERLDYQPKVVFTTAHDQYAVTAFELGALDYLLKPFGRERLSRVLQRVEATSNDSAVSIAVRAQESLEPERVLSRIFIRDGSRIIPVPLARLERAQGADDYVTVHAAGREHLVSVRLAELESQLPGTNFLRIHRSHIVNLDLIESIIPYDTNRVEVTMRSGVRIVASRAGSKLLRDLAL
jgi:two-component system LytT family response regulator